MKTLKELYLEAARVAEMIEDTKLTMGDVVRVHGLPILHTKPAFMDDYEAYTFALAIVEGKPVFKGDALYYRGTQMNMFSAPQEGWDSLSWNPPKPKTVMVEMLVEDVQYWCAFSKEELEGYFKSSNDPYAKRSMRFYNACDTALSCTSLGETE